MSTVGEFSVYWFDPDGYSHRERDHVNAQTAVELAASLIKRPAATIGVIARVIITDGGDCCCFDWLYQQGVRYPPQAVGRVPA